MWVVPFLALLLVPAALASHAWTSQSVEVGAYVWDSALVTMPEGGPAVAVTAGSNAFYSPDPLAGAPFERSLALASDEEGSRLFLDADVDGTPWVLLQPIPRGTPSRLVILAHAEEGEWRVERVLIPQMGVAWGLHVHDGIPTILSTGLLGTTLHQPGPTVWTTRTLGISTGLPTMTHGPDPAEILVCDVGLAGATLHRLAPGELPTAQVAYDKPAGAGRCAVGLVGDEPRLVLDGAARGSDGVSRHALLHLRLVDGTWLAEPLPLPPLDSSVPEPSLGEAEGGLAMAVRLPGDVLRVLVEREGGFVDVTPPGISTLSVPTLASDGEFPVVASRGVLWYRR